MPRKKKSLMERIKCPECKGSNFIFKVKRVGSNPYRYEAYFCICFVCKDCGYEEAVSDTWDEFEY